jgi:outer membrane protein
MTSIRTLTLALASLMAVSPAAFAQDASTDTASSAAGKRFAVVGGAAILHPDSDPLPGSRIDIDGDIAPTISASWYATDNIAVELWGAADKFNHRVRGDAGKIGTVEQQPMALSGQYHFGTPDQVMRPFVGLGYYESNFSNEDIAGGGDHVGLETAKGAIATAGVDFNINERWFARADARYLKGDAEMRVAGQGTGEELTLDPWVVGVGIGARF